MRNICIISIYMYFFNTYRLCVRRFRFDISRVPTRIMQKAYILLLFLMTTTHRLSFTCIITATPYATLIIC